MNFLYTINVHKNNSIVSRLKILSLILYRVIINQEEKLFILCKVKPQHAEKRKRF